MFLQCLFCLFLGGDISLDGEKAGDIACIVKKGVDGFFDGDKTAVFGFVDDFTSNKSPRSVINCQIAHRLWRLAAAFEETRCCFAYDFVSRISV